MHIISLYLVMLSFMSEKHFPHVTTNTDQNFKMTFVSPTNH